MYEVGGLRSGTTFSLRLTGHNAAGATTTTVSANTGPGGGLGAQPAGSLEEAPLNSLHNDPRLLASAAASALALALTVSAAVLCLRRRESQLLSQVDHLTEGKGPSGSTYATHKITMRSNSFGHSSEISTLIHHPGLTDFVTN